MTDRFTEVAVDTKAQSYILTMLHETHTRILRLLVKIEGEARDARERDYFDTPFLLNPCAAIATAVAEHGTLREVARYAGCTPDQIKAVCVGGHVIVEAAA